MTPQQEYLLDFVKLKHGDQKRKYTNEPYWNHVLSVASIVSKHEDGCFEIALCHDLFEDTTCTFDQLYKEMIELNYSPEFTYNVCVCVKELTDKYTKEEYPYLNREVRKKNECDRLIQISYLSQTVKYADLIDNTSSIAKYDKDFAKIYLKEKEDILEVMDKGNKVLYQLCKNTLIEAQVAQQS